MGNINIAESLIEAVALLRSFGESKGTVYVDYASDAYVSAAQFCGALEKTGLRIVMFNEDGGCKIDECDIFLCIVTDKYFTNTERLDYALRSGVKTIVATSSVRLNVPEGYTSLMPPLLLELLLNELQRVGCNAADDSAAFSLPFIEDIDYIPASPQSYDESEYIKTDESYVAMPDSCEEEEEKPLSRKEELHRRLEAARAAREAQMETDMDTDTTAEPYEPEKYAPSSPTAEPYELDKYAPSSPKAKSMSKPVRVTAKKADSVSFSAITPETVKKGEYSNIELFMYTKSQRKIVDKAKAEMLKQSGSVLERGQGGFKVSRGTLVTAVLTSDDVEISDASETRRWEGKSAQFGFQFFVPEHYEKRQAAFTCHIYFCGVRITRLSFAVRIASNISVPVKIRRFDYKKAFVSYSHKDKQRVLTQLAVIQLAAPKMKFWLDSQSLEPGELWEKMIYKAIRGSDVLLLFWSEHSSASGEVHKEWAYALRKKGLGFIAPVPLDPPDKCPPPPELSKLHFGHSSFDDYALVRDISFENGKSLHYIA